jgi:formylglycine-generating enzyme required for sulfatase activity
MSSQGELRIMAIVAIAGAVAACGPEVHYASASGTGGAGTGGAAQGGGGPTCVQVGQSCSSDSQCCSPQMCFGSICSVPPSCVGLPNTCGPGGNESCCANTVVPGGSYNRSNDPMYPAKVGDFRLDRFEITVGRFRRFVEAYPGSKPLPGAGVHPLIANSGWDAGWDTTLPADQADLRAAVECYLDWGTWTDTAGGQETLPMNCMSWYEAFAFCAWDGGRLPTEAEWNYAAAGGAEQREYPWSDPPGSMTIDPSYAVYHCTGNGSPAAACAFTDILNVGSKSPKGDGKWGQADLGGGMWEWNLDWYVAPYSSTACSNCANTMSGSSRVLRGGSWYGTVGAAYPRSSYRYDLEPFNSVANVGARCVRTP